MERIFTWAKTTKELRSHSWQKIAVGAVICGILGMLAPWCKLLSCSFLPQTLTLIGMRELPLSEQWDNKAFMDQWKPGRRVDQESDIRVRDDDTVTADDLIDCVEKRSCILLWKRFLGPDLVEKYAQLKPGDFANGTYPFNVDQPAKIERWKVKRAFAKLDLQEAMERMQKGEKLYMGFNTVFGNDNIALKNKLASICEKVNDKMPGLFDPSQMYTHSFLYHGNEFQASQHQAWSPDFSIQIANSKLWRFVHPRHTPRMRPGKGDVPGVLWSLIKYVHGTDIPFTEVVAEPGDMMYFPEHWWHEVHNVEPESFGLMIGFRSQNEDWVFSRKAFTLSWPMFAHKITAFLDMRLRSRDKDGPEGLRDQK